MLVTKAISKQIKKHLGPYFNQAVNAVNEYTSPAQDRVKSSFKHWAVEKTGQTADGQSGLAIFAQEFAGQYKTPSGWNFLASLGGAAVITGALSAFAQYQDHETESLLNFPNTAQGHVSTMASCFIDDWQQQRCIAFVGAPNPDKVTDADIAIYRIDDTVFNMETFDSLGGQAWVHVSDPQEALNLVLSRNDAEQSTPAFINGTLDQPMAYDISNAGWISGFFEEQNAEKGTIIVRPNLDVLEQNWAPAIDISTFNPEPFSLNDIPIVDFERDQWETIADAIEVANENDAYGYSDQQISAMPDSPAEIALRDGSNIGLPLGFALWAGFNLFSLGRTSRLAAREMRTQLDANPYLGMD